MPEKMATFDTNFPEMLILPEWQVGIVEIDGVQFPRLSIKQADGQLHIMLSVDSAQQMAAALDLHINTVADRRASAARDGTKSPPA